MYENVRFAKTCGEAKFDRAYFAVLVNFKSFPQSLDTAIVKQYTYLY